MKKLKTLKNIRKCPNCNEGIPEDCCVDYAESKAMDERFWKWAAPILIIGIFLFLVAGIPLMTMNNLKPYLEQLNKLCPEDTTAEITGFIGVYYYGNCIGNDSVIKYELNNGQWLKVK